MAYFPIVGRLHCGSSSVEHLGFWEMKGYGVMSMYKSDWKRIGGEYNLIYFFLINLVVVHLVVSMLSNAHAHARQRAKHSANVYAVISQKFTLISTVRVFLALALVAATMFRYQTPQLSSTNITGRLHKNTALMQEHPPPPPLRGRLHVPKNNVRPLARSLVF